MWFEGQILLGSWNSGPVVHACTRIFFVFVSTMVVSFTFGAAEDQLIFSIQRRHIFSNSTAEIAHIIRRERKLPLPVYAARPHRKSSGNEQAAEKSGISSD